MSVTLTFDLGVFGTFDSNGLSTITVEAEFLTAGQHAAAFDTRAAHHRGQFVNRKLEVHAASVANQMWMLPVPRAFS